MTDRIRVQESMARFRMHQAGLMSRREMTFAKAMDASSSNASLVGGSGAVVSRIVAESSLWTTEDEIQTENYMASAVYKAIGALLLILVGIALVIWIVGKVV